MIPTVIVSTSPRWRGIVSRLFAARRLDSLHIGWLQLETGNSLPDENRVEATVEVVESGVLDEGESSALSDVKRRLSRQMRQLLSESGNTIDKMGAGGRGSFSHLILLGSLYEHGANQLLLAALGAAFKARELFAGSPRVRIDIVGLLPSESHNDEAFYAANKAIFETLEPLHDSSRPGEPYATYHLLTALEDDPPLKGGEMPESAPDASDLLVTMVDYAVRFEREQVSAGHPPAGSFMGLYGFADVAYGVGDFLRALARAEIVDFRHELLLEELPTEPAEVKELVKAWKPWKSSVEQEIDQQIDQHMEAGFNLPGDARPPPPTASDDLQAFETELRVFAARAQSYQHTLRENLEPLEDSTIEAFTGSLQRHWDQLVDKDGFSVPIASSFARSLCEGAVEPLTESGLLDERRKTVLAICRGDIIGPLKEVVADPAAKVLLDGVVGPTTLSGLVETSDDPALQVAHRLLSDLPSDYDDEEEVIGWMERSLTVLPKALEDAWRALCEKRLPEHDEKIEAHRAEKPGFFGKSEHQRKEQELLAARAQEIRGIQEPFIALAGAYSEQVKQCHGRARWLGAWRSLRGALEELCGEVTIATRRIRNAMDVAYGIASEDLARTNWSPSISDMLLETERFSPKRIEKCVRATRAAGVGAIMPGRRIRKHAEKEIESLSELIPVKIDELIPKTLTQALWDPTDPENYTFYFEIIDKLASTATRHAKVDPTATTSKWAPVVLPLMAVEGGDGSPLGSVMGSRKLPPFFPGLAGRKSSWTVLDGKPGLLELRFAALGLTARHWGRHQSMIENDEEYESYNRGGEGGGVVYSKAYEVLSGGLELGGGDEDDED